jgi:hypothetical protein
LDHYLTVSPHDPANVKSQRKISLIDCNDVQLRRVKFCSSFSLFWSGAFDKPSISAQEPLREAQAEKKKADYPCRSAPLKQKARHGLTRVPWGRDAAEKRKSNV